MPDVAIQCSIASGRAVEARLSPEALFSALMLIKVVQLSRLD